MVPSFPRSLGAEETGGEEEEKKKTFSIPENRHYFSKTVFEVVFNLQISVVVLVKNNNFPCVLRIISPTH